MSRIGAIGISQYQPHINRNLNVHNTQSSVRSTQSSASEEASESPAEKAAEAKSPSTNILDRYA